MGVSEIRVGGFIVDGFQRKILDDLRAKLLQRANNKCDPIHSLMVKSKGHAVPTGVNIKTNCWNRTESPNQGTDLSVRHEYKHSTYTKHWLVRTLL